MGRSIERNANQLTFKVPPLINRKTTSLQGGRFLQGVHVEAQHNLCSLIGALTSSVHLRRVGCEIKELDLKFF